MGSETTKETKEERLARLVDEVSADATSRVKALESLSRDAVLGAEQLIAVNNAKLKLQRAAQLQRAHEIGEKLNAALGAGTVDAGEVSRLLFIKTLLVADISVGMDGFDGVLKVLATASKDLGSRQKTGSSVPNFGPRKGTGASDA